MVAQTPSGRRVAVLGLEFDPMKYRIKFLILTLLAIKPAHGYELIKRLEEVTGGSMRGGPGTIYPMLRELQESGMVEESLESRGGRSRKVYRLTERGALALLSHLDAFHTIMNRILAVTTEARRKLEEALSGRSRPCPPSEVLEILRKARASIDAYIRMLEERARECR